jgi:hypothetical protein
MTGGKNTPQKPGCDDVNEASLRIRLLGEAELLVGGSPRLGSLRRSSLPACIVFTIATLPVRGSFVMAFLRFSREESISPNAI